MNYSYNDWCLRFAILTLLALATIQQSDGFSASPPPSSNNNNGNGNSNSNNSNQKHISSSQRLRFEEEQRRISRRNENIPGRTSAIPNAQNLPINVQKTQSEWYNQASNMEKEIKEYTNQGMQYFRGMELEKANEAFDYVFSLKPNTYCWQAGIVKFYLNQYYDAAQCFVNCANVYESKFGIVASEERIWRDACELKINHLGLSNRSIRKSSNNNKSKTDKNENHEIDGREALFAVARMNRNDDDVSIGQAKETRKVVRIARDLFSSSIQHDLSNEALARGKLRSICGEYETKTKNAASSSVSPFKVDKKMWRLNSWFYLGLHYDVLDDKENSKDCMKMALRQCASSFGNGDDGEDHSVYYAMFV